MIAVRRWAPAALSGVFVVLAILPSTRTRRTPVVLQPLPPPVHVSSDRLAELNAETSRPLFAPTRSNAPIGAPSNEPQTPPPQLTGIVLGGNKAIALVKLANGNTTIANVGDTVDGWLIAGIAPRQITFARGGVEQTIALEFGTLKSQANTTPGSAGVQTHTLMANPSFDGLAAVRQRGLPETNIPLGSPLIPQQ